MASRADIITIEVGSTITKVFAFSKDTSRGRGGIVGRADSLTTADTSIMIGVNEALARLDSEFSIKGADEFFATSSAAGGLRMTVHGLTRELTARAAQEATLGAGANIKLLTAGLISSQQKERVEQIDPNLIMLAGGVDWGEEVLVLQNAAIIASMAGQAPVVYAGNCALQEQVREIFANSRHPVSIVDNVYPQFNILNIGPVRRIIQTLFSERLVIAPGMDELRHLCNHAIMPVPAACLQAAEVLSEDVGNLVVIDLGGATTDVHSVISHVSKGNIDPQIFSARTVEGDLGVFVSAESVWHTVLGHEGKPQPLAAVPKTPQEIAVTRQLALACVEAALVRHAGVIIHGTFNADGSHTVKGRDLRSVRLIVGTGGALSRIPQTFDVCIPLFDRYRSQSLVPGSDVEVCIDREYVFSACGCFARTYPELAKQLMHRSIGR
ncbi:MAG: glutamate mutase L [Chitinivibrionales bacterium]|nr:glutamate mutase L [Chitinivibrionales bacterium]